MPNAKNGSIKQKDWDEWKENAADVVLKVDIRAIWGDRAPFIVVQAAEFNADFWMGKSLPDDDSHSKSTFRSDHPSIPVRTIYCACDLTS